VLECRVPPDARGATVVELLLNLKTAKALGIDLPASVLARADELNE
jgi:ABC-type uncharacterized transport system substrate-binding protein